VATRYVIAWGRTAGVLDPRQELRRATWRVTQHAAVLDAVDVLWREPSLDQVQVFCEDQLIGTLSRSDPRIGETLAALEHAVREIYEEDSA
jgi:hypothetical protein